MPVVTDPIGQFSAQQYPFITDETRQMLAQEKIRLLRDEHASTPAADLNRSERFIFRSLPGTHRMIHHNIDIPPVVGIKHYDHYRFQWERRQIEAAGLGPESDPNKMKSAVAAAEKRAKDLVWRNSSSDLIRFNRVRRHNECYFATDDEVLAGYLRELVKRKVGGFANVYEVSGKTRIVVGDKAFPDTELGLRTAKAYARDNGIDELKFVNE